MKRKKKCINDNSYYNFLLFGSVSQELETTKFTNLILANRLPEMDIE